MKLTKTTINNNVDTVEVQLSLNDVQGAVRQTTDPLRGSDRIVKSTLKLNDAAGSLASQVHGSMYKNEEIDPVVFFLASKAIIISLSEIALSLGYDMDDIALSIIRDAARKK